MGAELTFSAQGVLVLPSLTLITAILRSTGPVGSTVCWQRSLQVRLPRQLDALPRPRSAQQQRSAVPSGCFPSSPPSLLWRLFQQPAVVLTKTARGEPKPRLLQANQRLKRTTLASYSRSSLLLLPVCASPCCPLLSAASPLAPRGLVSTSSPIALYDGLAPRCLRPPALPRLTTRLALKRFVESMRFLSTTG